MLTFVCPSCKNKIENPRILVFKMESFHIPMDEVRIECEACKHKEKYENIIS